MSADKHRGIRRIKQKRAKALKTQEREQRSAAVAQGKNPATPPARRPRASRSVSSSARTESGSPSA